MLKLIYKKEKKKYINNTLVFAGSRFHRLSSLDTSIENNEITDCNGEIKNMCFQDGNIKINKTIILRKINDMPRVTTYGFINLYQHSEKLLVKTFNDVQEFEKEKMISKKILDLQIIYDNCLAVIPSYFNNERKCIIMHYKDDDLTNIMSFPNHLHNYTDNWKQIIFTIQKLIGNDVYVFDLKLENIVYQKDLDTKEFKFYLIDLGGYMILENTFISKYNEFINTFPLIYEFMKISKNDDNDIYKLNFYSEKTTEITFPNLTLKLTLQQLKNILYYNVLYSLLASILIFLVYQRNWGNQTHFQNQLLYNTLIINFIFKNKDDRSNLDNILKDKYNILFNQTETQIYDILKQLLYYCNDYSNIYVFLNKEISKSLFTFKNIIDILNGKKVLNS